MSAAGMASHQVELLYDSEGALNPSPVCAGTIISSYLILTVFSCLAGKNETLIKIRANGKNQNQSQIRMIDEVFSYAAVDSEASPFDVAVIRLNSELELDSLHTSKIRYAKSQSALNEDFSGETSFCHESGLTEVRTLTPSECSKILKGNIGEEQNFICVESLQNFVGASQLPMNLDGSSLICSDVLYGVLALNSTNGEETQGKRVFTSVAKYSHWIRLLFEGRADDQISDSADDLTPSILNGKAVNQTADPVPYQLSIRFDENHVCGGVILDKKTALSAAHCFDQKYYKDSDFNLTSFLVVAGEQNLHENDTTEQIFRIEKVFIHPKYTGTFGGNDIAVIHIKGEFNFTDRVNNIWISSPTTKTPNFQGFNGTATGWGKTRSNGPPSPILLSTEMELLDHPRCKKRWGFLKDSMICGYNNFSNICEGDSGGPLVIKNYEHGSGPHTKKDLLVGLSSFGPRECEGKNIPNGFTNVSFFYEWISKVRSNSLCSPSQFHFQCFNGECIQNELKCNKKFDCADGSDEKMCFCYRRVTELNLTLSGKIEVDQIKNPVPYQLSIRFNGRHVCGGVILDKRTALSAAHCFDPKYLKVQVVNLTSFLVVAGEQNLHQNDSTEQILKLEKVVVHPNYTDVFKRNDIAVIVIKGEFNFTNRVSNIWISSATTKTPNFQGFNGTVMATATGWGKTRTHKEFSSVLKSLQLEIMDLEECSKKWRFLTDSMFCGYSNFSSMCEGEAGGPLVLKNYEHGSGPHTKKDLLVGISSFFPRRCEKPNAVNGFTNVSHFYEWIAETRSNSLCSSSQFQCFNGQCIQESRKCSNKFDCEDGSDEKVCESQSRVTASCGGFINLAQTSEHEVIYQVTSAEHHRQRESICLWIVSTGQRDAGASIEATLLNNPSAQFNSTTDIIFASYNLTIGSSQYKTVNKLGTKYTVGGPFMTLYYRTNSSAPSAGFHLKLEDSVTQSIITERLDVNLIPIPNANLNDGEIREFLYPSTLSGVLSRGGSRTSTYYCNEHTFFIIKPQNTGNKIRVNLAFVDTEEKYDWLEIGTYRVRPTTLTRFSGRSNWTEMILEGLEDEPIFFYFHSDESEEREGFKIQYSEIMAPKPSSCGGLVNFTREHEILYKVPEELRGQKSVCVWVVAAAGGSQILAEVLSNPRAHFEPPESTLLALYDFKMNGSSHTNMSDKYTTWTIDQPFFVLYFRTNSSAPNSGFHIHLKEAGKKQVQKPVKYLELALTSTLVEGAADEFKYPLPPFSNYTNDERTFIIVKPATRHGKLQLEVKSIETEEDFDWMEIMTVKSQPTSEFWFTGIDAEFWLLEDTVFEAEEDEPFIIYFQSDESGTASGFQFSYFEQRMSDRS